jgi:hypothetical protein
MKKTLLLLLALFCLAVSSYGQKGGTPVFDNFDRSQGVPVFLPATPITAVSRKGKRGRGGKYKVVVEDKLVKRTGMIASVTDGLAQREGVAVSGTKLAMGSSADLKGFTTGNPVHDSYIVDSARRYNIDPLLIYSQMHQESSFQPSRDVEQRCERIDAVDAGYCETFRCHEHLRSEAEYRCRCSLHAMAARYIRRRCSSRTRGLQRRRRCVMKYGGNVPPYRETQEYVRRITSRYNSISNGRYIQTARAIGNRSASLVQREARPLSVYEPSVLAVRTADGKMMLMNQ